MRSKMKWMIVLLMAVLLQSCASSGSHNAEIANKSALYDPPTVTLSPGVVYPFFEGTLTGTGQKFHSDYSYRRAVIIGSK